MIMVFETYLDLAQYLDQFHKISYTHDPQSIKWIEFLNYTRQKNLRFEAYKRVLSKFQLELETDWDVTFFNDYWIFKDEAEAVYFKLSCY